MPKAPSSWRKRLAPLRLGLGSDQIVHRLGLGEVHPAVEEGAASELSRLSRPGAECHQRIGDARQDRAPPVQEELGRVLAGVAAWTGQPHDHRLVDVAQPT